MLGGHGIIVVLERVADGCDGAETFAGSVRGGEEDFEARDGGAL